MSHEYLIYNGNNFEPVRIQFNELHNIPPEGINGFVNGAERTDGIGLTTNYAITTLHPSLDKGYILKKDDTPQFALDAVDTTLTREQMEADGWFPDER